MSPKSIVNKIVLFVGVPYGCFVGFVLFRACSEKVPSRPIDEWKTTLRAVGFKGTVVAVSDFDFSERSLFAVWLKNVTLENEKLIPKTCDFFEYKQGTLKFAAYSETVKRWPDYGLEEGCIIEKKVNSDTLFVYTAYNKPKYVFQLFDGLDSNWVPRQWPKQ